MRLRGLLLVVVAGAAGVVPATAASTVTVQRLEGATRYETAAAIAVASPPSDGNVRAVLVNGEDFPDALAATPLAGYFAASVLLTPRDHLHPAALGALRQLGTEEVWLLGGEDVLSQQVTQDLARNGYSVVRLAGGDRYETAVAAAGAMIDSGSHRPPAHAVVASGESFADSLAAAPFLFSRSGDHRSFSSLLLTGRASLPAATERAIREHPVYEVVIVGGTAAVSQEVEDRLRSICWPNVSPIAEQRCLAVQRIAGPTRQATAVAIAHHAITAFGWSVEHVNLARGDTFADALAGGRHAAAEKSVLVLTGSPSTLTEETRAFLAEQRAVIGALHVYGDRTAVSDAVVEEARRAATG